MNTTQRISAAVSYIPVIGWLYVIVFARKDEAVVFHLRQSIGLVIGMLGFFLLWVVAAWLLTWVPYGGVLAVALFSLVITALLVGVIAWLVGIVNALRGKVYEVPLFGSIAHRLPSSSFAGRSQNLPIAKQADFIEKPKG